ncbi:hypothetical protein DEAC_c42030 [Desulfosporosinus acididurans]|uniref:Uncharacterized protein n=1 Tax=Desulfosporosinus acididurans TaxID=476652 RepID=A0A0J1IGQ5_9FIRM|nr:hypothetical protein DEAC_c42030 [Desulfosporosinus acididurans]
MIALALNIGVTLLLNRFYQFIFLNVKYCLESAPDAMKISKRSDAVMRKANARNLITLLIPDVAHIQKECETYGKEML